VVRVQARSHTFFDAGNARLLSMRRDRCIVGRGVLWSSIGVTLTVCLLRQGGNDLRCCGEIELLVADRFRHIVGQVEKICRLGNVCMV